MNPPTTRSFTPSRIVALALVAIVVGGLAFLRFAPDGGTVSVPSGAKAGELTLEPCTYTTEVGDYAADCGTLVVPENRADSGSRLIAVPVTRIRALSADPAEPVFRLEGGPGKTNMRFSAASRFAENRDVVLVGYRGVDGSVRLDCPEVESALKHSSDLLGQKTLQAYGDAYRDCAGRLTDEGVDVGGYGVVAQVDDLEAARKALGYDHIDLVSESAGTRTAMIYSWRYPKSIHRSVMIAVNPPGKFLWDGKTTDEQIARYAELCAKDSSCSDRTDDLAASMRETVADMPDRWLFLPIKEGNVRVASFFGLMESTSANAPLSAPMTIDAWHSADEGDASAFWFQSLAADLAFPKAFVWGQYAAFGSSDAEAAREYFALGRERDSILDDPGSTLGWAGGRLADVWPPAAGASDYSRPRLSQTETLLVGGELDFATPPQNATRDLLPYLPNGDQVVLEQFGHTMDFWETQPEAGTKLINTYLASGKVDDSGYVPQTVDFTPAVTQGTIAKIVAGAMVGLAATAVFSLLWLPIRVHRRGRFGRKSRAFLRSVYPFVLGIGGWLLGALVVLTFRPTVPLDDELLAVLSAGVPVGLGIYWAWVDRDWSSDTKLAGIVAAGAGAIVGAWLGYHAATDMAALFTGIVGAAAGANLTLVLLEMMRERSARRAVATTRVEEPLDAGLTAR